MQSLAGCLLWLSHAPSHQVVEADNLVASGERQSHTRLTWRTIGC